MGHVEGVEGYDQQAAIALADNQLFEDCVGDILGSFVAEPPAAAADRPHISSNAVGPAASRSCVSTLSS